MTDSGDRSIRTLARQPERPCSSIEMVTTHHQIEGSSLLTRIYPSQPVITLALNQRANDDLRRNPDPDSGRFLPEGLLQDRAIERFSRSF